MHLSRRRLVLAAAISLVFISMPSIMMLDLTTTPLLAERMALLLFPGMMVAMMAANNAHAFSAWTTVLVSFVFWTGTFYVLLTFISRRKQGHA